MLHVCLVTDNNYTHYTMMCVYDIMIRQNPETEITFHIITDRLTEENIANLNKLTTLRNTTFDFIPIDATTIKADDKGNDAHHSAAAFLRILIPELLANKGINRALYIDSDMLCRRDLTELFEMDLQDKPLGLVRESTYLAFNDYRTIPWRKSDTNAGLILMDIPKLVEIGFTDKMKWMMEHATLSEIYTIIDRAYGKKCKLLPPVCQIPMHQFVANRFNSRQFCMLDQWNIYHNTNYETFQEIFDQTFFWHFCEAKNLYIGNSIVKSIYDVSEARLNAFLETNQQMIWQKSDDAEFEESCYSVINDIVAFNRREYEKRRDAYIKQRSPEAVFPPHVIIWSQYFDRVCCLHSLDKPNRMGPIYHELRRVSIEKNSELQYFRTAATRFDDSIYSGSDHILFDDTVYDFQRDNKVNQLMGYYQLFRELVGTGVQRALIVEDDILFLSDCLVTKEYLNNMPELWDYIKFERVNGPATLDKYKSSISEREYFHRNYTGGWLGSACCAYSYNAMKLAIQIIEEQLMRPDYILENRDDSRLNDLRRYVCAKNLVVEAGRSFESDYLGLANSEEYWPADEYISLAKGGQI